MNVNIATRKEKFKKMNLAKNSSIKNILKLKRFYFEYIVCIYKLYTYRVQHFISIQFVVIKSNLP